MTRKNPFDTKVLYRLLFIHIILQHFIVVIKLLFIKLVVT